MLADEVHELVTPGYTQSRRPGACHAAGIGDKGVEQSGALRDRHSVAFGQRFDGLTARRRGGESVIAI